MRKTQAPAVYISLQLALKTYYLSIMSNDNEEASFSLVIPGSPLTPDSDSRALSRARQVLQEQVQNLGFLPIPPDTAVGLEVNFVYPTSVQDLPDAMALNTIARELAIGILYDDNFQVCRKCVMKRVASNDEEVGSTEIRFSLVRV